MPVAEPDSTVHFPTSQLGPLSAVLRRVWIATGAMALCVLLVLVDRGGYTDNTDGHVSVLDAVYYATVTLSTTGYGDIVPATDLARLTNIVLITPLRILFLVVLVGTTLEVLTKRTRHEWRLARWRKVMRNHTVIIGYGTKGHSAITTLRDRGIPADQIVVIDVRAENVKEATLDGYAAIQGDATRSAILGRAQITLATQLIVAAARDDTAVLATLTARQMNPRMTIAAAVREEENVPLLRQSGADTVITSSDAAGRLLGMSALAPSASAVIEDLLTRGQGMDIIERLADSTEVGRDPRQLKDLILAVDRNGQRLAFDQITEIAAGDNLIVIPAAE